MACCTNSDIGRSDIHHANYGQTISVPCPAVTPLGLRDEFRGHADINTWVIVVSPHLCCNVYDNNNRALSVL